MTKQTIRVKGMHCNSCSIIITEALEEAGAKNVSVGLNAQSQQGMVTYESTLPKKKIKEIVEAQGEYFVR